MVCWSYPPHGCRVPASRLAARGERISTSLKSAARGKLISMTQTVRTNYGASLSPDATAFAHLVDDGGYPRAVQRFLRGWRASSSRDVELPVEGPVNRVMHSADGHWLACEVAPEGGSRSQIWVVTTDPDDRAARRIDMWPADSAGRHRRADRLGRYTSRGHSHRRRRCRQFLSDRSRRRHHDHPRSPVGWPARRRMGGRGVGARRAARLPRPDHAARSDRNRPAAHTIRARPPTPASSSTTSTRGGCGRVWKARRSSCISRRRSTGPTARTATCAR